MSLTEERNAVLVPSAGSNVPGAPADWTPPQGMETHVPVIFLDLNGIISFFLTTLHLKYGSYLYRDSTKFKQCP